jgi:rhamnosyltransferase
MGAPFSDREKICTVVVTYHPDGGFPARLDRVIPQTAAVIVVDNGSASGALDMLRALAARPGIEVVFNGENLGIASALNIGVRRAAAHGCTWALLLDQDTLIDEDMVERLWAAQAAVGDGKAPAVVGSRFRDTHGRAAESLRLEGEGESWVEVESVITSGSLLSLAAYRIVGPFRDEFFIDYVDTEYCFRARAAGYRVIETRQPLMAHTVGAPSAHQLPWGTKWTTNHSAERRYYIARNNTVLLREYGAANLRSWRMKSLTRCFRLCKRIVLYETDKAAKLAAVGEGWWDAMRGRMGPRRKLRAGASGALRD